MIWEVGSVAFGAEFVVVGALGEHVSDFVAARAPVVYGNDTAVLYAYGGVRKGIQKSLFAHELFFGVHSGHGKLDFAVEVSVVVSDEGEGRMWYR